MLYCCCIFVKHAVSDDFVPQHMHAMINYAFEHLGQEGSVVVVSGVGFSGMLMMAEN